MHRAIAAVAAMSGLAARAAVGYGPIDCGDVPPCGCLPIVICDPCAVVPEPTPPQAPGKLPAPRAERQVPQRAEAAQPTPAAPANEYPSPPNVNAPAVEPPTSTPAPPAEATPAGEQPTAPETPAPADDATRYSTPPAEQPTTPAADPYEGLFPPDENTAEAETPAPETPSTEPPATNETPSSEDAEESPRTPDYDELFPPGSSTGNLSAPGGWASEAPRPWKDADGRVLATGRIVGVTAQQLVLAGDDGAEQAFPYAALSNDDLRFLREQVAARRAELQAERAADELLAGQR
jgi:hypothetical protein